MHRFILIAGTAAAPVAFSAVLAGPLMSRAENPSYAVLRSEGPFELRAYPPMVVATVTVRGARGAAISDGFKIRLWNIR